MAAGITNATLSLRYMQPAFDVPLSEHANTRSLILSLSDSLETDGETQRTPRGGWARGRRSWEVGLLDAVAFRA